MLQVIFDIDGTLVESYDFDEQCFIDSIKAVTGLKVSNDWQNYPHLTDTGILKTFIARQAPSYSLQDLEPLVKSVFIDKIDHYLNSNSVNQVAGAVEFLKYLSARDDVKLGIATGGWGETARAKLLSAGFDLEGIALRSSNDHYSRTEIMRLVAADIELNLKASISYFGDAVWDLKACQELGFNFIAVGSRLEHQQAITDFKDIDKAIEIISNKKSAA